MLENGVVKVRRDKDVMIQLIECQQLKDKISKLDFLDFLEFLEFSKSSKFSKDSNIML